MVASCLPASCFPLSLAPSDVHSARLGSTQGLDLTVFSRIQTKLTLTALLDGDGFDQFFSLHFFWQSNFQRQGFHPAMSGEGGAGGCE